MPTTVTTTFALLKPDVTGTEKEAEILAALTAAGFTLIRSRRILHPKPHVVATHLNELRTRVPEAFDRTFPFLLQGPVLALKLSHSNGDPIRTLRALVGPTDPAKAPPETLRARFSTDSLASATDEDRGLRNAIHCADSPESVKEETVIWFERI